jgi:hypothetical protein
MSALRLLALSMEERLAVTAAIAKIASGRVAEACASGRT